MDVRAQCPGLHLEVVIPVRTAALQELPKARSAIRKEKQRSPALVLLHMNTLVRTNAQQLVARDGEDHMAKDDAAKRKLPGQPAAGCLTLAVGDFQGAR